MEIAADPALIGEVRRSLPALRNAAALGGGTAGVRRAIGVYFHAYPQPERSDAEWAGWWFPYEQILADLPESAITSAMVQWTKKPDARFLPAPGELYALARHVTTAEGRAYARAAAAARLADNPARSPAEPLRHVELPEIKGMPKGETKDWARQDAARFRAEAAERSRVIREETAPALPPLHGELAPGRHITPELAAITDAQQFTERKDTAA